MILLDDRTHPLPPPPVRAEVGGEDAEIDQHVSEMGHY